MLLDISTYLNNEFLILVQWIDTYIGSNYDKNFEVPSLFPEPNDNTQLNTNNNIYSYFNIDSLKTSLENARNIAEELELDMNILDANYTLDRKQLLFNFIADERVDFRELAKRLASLYKTRIELRQIGARDKARTICGIGQCGRPLCCSTFLNHIDSVTMNMAKNQNIALNPSKINGLCGRLLCCLTYEDEEYTRCQKGMPNVGQTVKTEFGSGKVVSVDILNRKYKVDIDNVIREIELGCDKCKK
jgi:cell fate regulator YaaT (PSP1 superfamily)